LRALLQIVSAICVTVCLVTGAPVVGQVQAPRKRLLLIGEEKGYRHEAVTHAMVTIERLGKETGLWDTVIRTDTEALTKRKLEYNAKNLDDFDAVVFYTGGTLEMDASQQADFLSFVHDEGKGFIGIHSATITFTKWPAYGEMIGGYFDEHPWGTFDAPVIVEDPAFPGMKQWPSAFTIDDEIYQIKQATVVRCSHCDSFRRSNVPTAYGGILVRSREVGSRPCTSTSSESEPRAYVSTEGE